eukprot:Skav217320  [mRNA]  locus=scaffold3163:350028:352888:+ [translate_table: standard]
MSEAEADRADTYNAVHTLFYCIGIGITILLMNLLIGVLGSNYDLYQDRAPELFNRARAKSKGDRWSACCSAWIRGPRP